MQEELRGCVVRAMFMKLPAVCRLQCASTAATGTVGAVASTFRMGSNRLSCVAQVGPQISRTWYQCGYRTFPELQAGLASGELFEAKSRGAKGWQYSVRHWESLTRPVSEQQAGVVQAALLEVTIIALGLSHEPLLYMNT